MNYKIAFKNAYPIMLGYFIVSTIFGISAVNSGLSIWFIVALSVFLYAGAGQFLFLLLLNSGASIFTTIITIFLVNLRLFLMSIYMTNIFDKKGFGKIFSLLYAYELTDEVFAFQSKNNNFGYAYFLTFNFLCHFSWVLGSLCGALLINIISNNISELNLEYVITAMMIYVLVVLIDSKTKLLVALISLLSMILLELLYTNYLNIFIATFIASTFGVWHNKKT